MYLLTRNSKPKKDFTNTTKPIYSSLLDFKYKSGSQDASLILFAADRPIFFRSRMYAIALFRYSP